MPTRSGVPFLLYPQATEQYPVPELVFVEPLGGPIGPGPSDRTMRVVDALGKPPYDPPLSMPPFRGPAAPPAEPGRGGGFAHLPLESRQFVQAHLFGCARIALNIWESYLGAPIRWFDLADFPVLELVPLVDWPNAQSGPGFIETGMVENKTSQLRLHALNLDVVAHEMSHAVLFSQLGVPGPGRLTAQFLGLHEAVSDVATLLTALHFDSVIDTVLRETGGNLYARNEANRIAELSSSEQIRLADTTTTMRDVAAIALAEDGTWRDGAGLGRNAHGLAAPMTGALFDVFVDLFQEGLVRRRLIAPDDDARGWTREETQSSIDRLDVAFRGNLTRFAPAFHAAVADARDDLGRCIGAALKRVSADDVDFDTFAGAMIAAAEPLLGRRAARAVSACFAWRGMAPALPRAARTLRSARPRYVAAAPLVVQLRAASCCMPGLERHVRGLELGVIINREHRAPE